MGFNSDAKIKFYFELNKYFCLFYQKTLKQRAQSEMYPLSSST
jgi:hypothetical protein